MTIDRHLQSLSDKQVSIWLKINERIQNGSSEEEELAREAA